MMTNKTVYQKMQDFLITESGFTEGCRNGCNHDLGLPDVTRITIRPDYCPIDGAATIVVTPTLVGMFVCRIPYNGNQWYRHGQEYLYQNRETLLEHIKRMMKQPVSSCWEES